MEHKKYYPFVRNNYFYGKLLSVRDFQEEQKYYNDKRRLSHFFTTGAGVVSGMNIVLLDEKTISLEQGFALDYTGREIIVEEAVTKKISTIEGFDDIGDTKTAYICIAYQEKEEELIHAMTGKLAGKNKYYNRIKESYKLFLTQEAENTQYLTQSHLIEKQTVLYQEQGLSITQITPRYVPEKQCAIIQFIIEKEDLPKTISFSCRIRCNGFQTEEYDDAISVYFQENTITANQKTILNYTVIAQKEVHFMEGFTLEEGAVTIENETYPLKNRTTPCEIGKISLLEYVTKKQMTKHFEDIVNIGGENKLYLAKITWIKQGEQYSVESIENMPFQQYVLSNTILAELLKQKQQIIPQKKQHHKEKITLPQQSLPQPQTASGTEIIETDFYSKKKSYFSEEIAHGLGSGDVMIQTALEDIIDQRDFFNMRKNVFGSSSVFVDSPFQTELPTVEIGVLSYPDRGTFRIGVQFKEDAHVTTVKVKWWALKKESKPQSTFAEVGGVTLAIEPNTVALKPREKYKFEVVFEGTDSRECKWKVLEEDGGKIDSNGVYEAPSKEGVYEISVESIKYPNKKATAFVVVKES